MKRVLTTMISIMIFVVLSQADAGKKETAKGKRRLEASLSYETLSPHDVYGAWKNFFLSYYVSSWKGTTLFFQAGAFSRNIGAAFLGVGGAYKDWGKRFYTYTALAAGTTSDYLPEFRLDNDFNLKLGGRNNIVATAGVTYINYHDVHESFILSLGCTAYFERWIATYRIFRNKSDPGNVTSFSHLLDVAFGRDGWQLTNLTLSFGKQAYLATHISLPEEVNQDSLFLVIRHRHWLGKGLGIIGDINYFKLDDGYEKFGLSIGIFKEF